MNTNACFIAVCATALLATTARAQEGLRDIGFDGGSTLGAGDTLETVRGGALAFNERLKSERGSGGGMVRGGSGGALEVAGVVEVVDGALALRAGSNIYELFGPGDIGAVLDGYEGRRVVLSGIVNGSRLDVQRIVGVQSGLGGTAAPASGDPVERAAAPALERYTCEFAGTRTSPEKDSWAQSLTYGGSHGTETESFTARNSKPAPLSEALFSACEMCGPGTRNLMPRTGAGYYVTTTCRFVQCVSQAGEPSDRQKTAAIMPARCADEQTRLIQQEGERSRQSANQSTTRTVEEIRSAIDEKYRPKPEEDHTTPGVTGAGRAPFVDYGRFYRGRSYPSHPSQVGGN